MVNESRIINEFIELVQIDSETGNERALADLLKQKLLALGLNVSEDNAATKTGGNAGNLIAFLTTSTKGPKIMFSAHMDTVQPGKNIRPLINDGVISSQGETILGADDKAGIVAILEMLRVIREEQIVHPPLQIIFTVSEEGGLKGAKSLNQENIYADFAYILDSSGSAGHIVIEGPAQKSFQAMIKGKKAHAGVEPEKGVNAIQLAARALARMNLGRIDAETTANIGIIKGGLATNIVPDEVLLEGEIRSLKIIKLEKQTKHMEDCLQMACQELGGKVIIQTELVYPQINIDQEALVVKIALEAARNLSFPSVLAKTGGGSDANILNQHLPTVNLGCGMTNVHTTEEQITIKDLVRNALFLVEIVRVASKYDVHAH